MGGVRALIRQNGATKELPDGVALNGTFNDISLLPRQSGSALTLLTSDTVIDGTTYLWEADIVPIGRAAYLEAVATGINLGSATGVMISLYTAAGVLVVGSTLTITSATPQRVRLSLALNLVNNTEYVVRYRTSGLLGTAALYRVSILIR